MISAFESSAGQGDKVDDCLWIKSLVFVMLKMNVALTFRQLRTVIVYDERKMRKNLVIT